MLFMLMLYKKSLTEDAYKILFLPQLLTDGGSVTWSIFAKYFS